MNPCKYHEHSSLRDNLFKASIKQVESKFEHLEEYLKSITVFQNLTFQNLHFELLQVIWTKYGHLPIAIGGHFIVRNDLSFFQCLKVKNRMRMKE